MENLEIRTPGGLESWNPTSRTERERWGTRLQIRLPGHLMKCLACSTSATICGV